MTPVSGDCVIPETKITQYQVDISSGTQVAINTNVAE